MVASQLVSDGSWRIERRLRYDRDHRVIDGIPQFGFHVDRDVFVVEYQQGYIGLIRHDQVRWTAGARDPGLAQRHVQVPLEEPRFVGRAEASGLALATDAGRVWRIDIERAEFEVVAVASDLGLVDPGNAVWLADSGIWINDIVGHQLLRLTATGDVAQRIGDGTAGFQTETVGFAQARFGNIYDLRAGPDGRLYVLDSTNYAVRVVDPRAQRVETICGDGRPGWRGDGGPAVQARLGGDPGADFDGPWSLVVDDRGDLYIGDTHNHAVRRIDAATAHISTIAHPGMSGTTDQNGADGRADAASLDGEPFALICGMDFDTVNHRLLIPDWVSDEADELVVLAPTRSYRDESLQPPQE